MPAELMLWHPDHLGDAKGKLQFRAVNTLNTPIVGTPVWLANGQAIADVYEFTCTDNDGGTATLTRECLIGGVKNPYRDMAGVTAVADGSTPNLTLCPGLSVVLSASIAAGWKGRIAIYNYLEDDGSYTAFFGYGVVQSGAASTGQRIAVKNIGDATGTSCKLYALPGFYWTSTNGGESFVSAVANHSNATRHKLAAAGSYVITFQDFKDATGGKKSCDIYVNKDGGGAHKCVEDALMDGSTVYQYGVTGYDDANDYLAGLAITMADTTSDPSSVVVTLVVTADYTWTEFAPDASGSAGTYANQDLVLTQSGGPTGTVEAGNAPFAWHRQNLPDAATAGLLRKVCVRTSGLTV